MKAAVLKKTRISADRVITAFPEFSVPPIESVAKWENKQFFYPTNQEIYKNVDGIVEACDILHKQGYTDFTVTFNKKFHFTNTRIIIWINSLKCNTFILGYL